LADDGICPFDREMNLGDENSSIKELQKFLALDKSVYTGPATGYFGPLTQKAVKSFQEKTGLLANGKIDLATATVLCQIYLSYKSSEPVNNDDSLTVDNSCFLKTLNLELGYYDEVTEEVLNLQK
jgi:peptidoglycan hydrolase-like protein with peptidoglycan-binding domain